MNEHWNPLFLYSTVKNVSCSYWQIVRCHRFSLVWSRFKFVHERGTLVYLLLKMQTLWYRFIVICIFLTKQSHICNKCESSASDDFTFFNIYYFIIIGNHIWFCGVVDVIAAYYSGVLSSNSLEQLFYHFI